MKHDQIGAAKTSPNKKLLWLDVAPKAPVLKVRESLHSMDLFRTDLPLTKGFLPHLTISEAAREPEENFKIIVGLNSKLDPHSTSFDRVSWIIPNEDFIFHEHMSFAVGPQYACE
jgi:hypothetical protein